MEISFCATEKHKCAHFLLAQQQRLLNIVDVSFTGVKICVRSTAERFVGFTSLLIISNSHFFIWKKAHQEQAEQAPGTQCPKLSTLSLSTHPSVDFIALSAVRSECRPSNHNLCFSGAQLKDVILGYSGAVWVCAVSSSNIILKSSFEQRKAASQVLWQTARRGRDGLRVCGWARSTKETGNEIRKAGMGGAPRSPTSSSPGNQGAKTLELHHTGIRFSRSFSTAGLDSRIPSLSVSGGDVEAPYGNSS